MAIIRFTALAAFVTALVGVQILGPTSSAAIDTDADALVQPISMTFSPDGRVYIGEKRGTIRMAETIGEVVQNARATKVADFQSAVYDFGDHGLTSVAHHDGHLYTTFMERAEPCGTGDYDQEWDTTCPSFGRVARFEVLDDGQLGQMEHVVGGERDPIFCASASSHGLDNVFEGPDGELYVAAGDGAGFGDADIGQHDGDPCGDGGAFRAQVDTNAMGKILRLDPETGALTMVAKGLRNPFRQTIHDGEIYSTNTGWYTFEEINLIEHGGNYGWPCWEGSEPAPVYSDDLGESCADVPNTGPFHQYHHSGASAITALASFDGKLYFSDHAERWIRSVVPGEEPETVMASEDLYAVDLKVAPDGDLYLVNIWHGRIEPVTDTDPAATSGEIIPDATITVEPSTNWAAGDRLSASVNSNLFDPAIVRAPVDTTWSVELVGGGTAAPVPFTTSDDQRRIELAALLLSAALIAGAVRFLVARRSSLDRASRDKAPTDATAGSRPSAR